MPVGCIAGTTPAGRIPQLDVGQLKEKCPQCVDGFVLLPASGLALVKKTCARCGGKGKA